MLVIGWIKIIKLCIHPTKSKHMFVGSSYTMKNKVGNLPISINNVPVPIIDSQKCLGVILDEKLSWENHIEMIYKKVGTGIAVIKPVKSFVSKDTLQVLYIAIVQSYFDYCCPLWTSGHLSRLALMVITDGLHSYFVNYLHLIIVFLWCCVK